MKIFATLFLFALTHLTAAEFKSEKECVPGAAVQDRENLTGKIVSVEGSMCKVKLDKTGEATAYLYWMLRTAWASAETDDKLIVGPYLCYVGTQAAGSMRIPTLGTYERDGKTGKYRVEASRKIVFESGPFSEYHAKLLAGPKIGMNLNGGTFYNLTCDPKR